MQLTSSGRAAIGITAIIAFVSACGDGSRKTSAVDGVASTDTQASSAENELMGRAETKLRSGVGFDPSQTKFRNVYVVEGNAVCGEIAWVDASGKLRSFVPFMYRYGIEVKDSEDLRSARFAQVWDKLCESRPVISGTRSPLSPHQRDDFTQRLQTLAANGGAEEPERFHAYLWRDLEQIEKDLDAAETTKVESTQAKEDAESAEFVKQMREATKQK